MQLDHTYDNLVTIFPGNRVVKFEMPEGESGEVLDKPAECPIDEAKRLEGETEHLNVLGARHTICS